MRTHHASFLALACAIPLLGQTSPAPAVPDKPASVEGSVVNSITGEPVVRAHVQLQMFADQSPKTYGALTGPDGKFSVTSMAAGMYFVMVDRTGFVNDPRIQASQQLRLSAGDAKTEFKLKLMPCGSISGRVLNPEGEPLAGIDVSAAANVSAAMAVPTDDKGNFRIGGLTPGKYYVYGRPKREDFPPEIRTDGTVEEHYRRTYSPNLPSEVGAPQIEVAAGADTPGVEVHLLRGPIVRISGLVTGLPGTERSNVSLQEIPNGFGGGGAVQPDGTFRIWRIDPGKYRLTARKFESARTMLQSAPLELEVADANIDNIELRVIPAGDLQGRVEYDDEQARRAPQTAMTMSVGPTPAGQNTSQSRRVFAQSPFVGMRAGVIGADDSFTLEGLQPDIYHLRMASTDVYVKSMLLGQTQIDGSTFDLRNGATGQTLTIRLSSAMAQVSGTVHDGDHPAPNVRVLLIEDNGGDFTNVRAANSNASGAYTLTGITPGKYHLLATPDNTAVPVQRGKINDEYTARAEAVELAPKDQQTRDLKLH